MASSAQGLKRHHSPIPNEGPETKRARIQPQRFDPYKQIPQELWVKIFSHILPGDIRPVSLACLEFSLIRIPSFREHLTEKNELTASDIRWLHPPLTQLLVYNNDRFDKSGENERKEIQRLWTDHGVIKIFPYIIFHCKKLTVLDLRDPRYSLSTFLGVTDDFRGEVLTLDCNDSLEFDQNITIYPIVNRMLEPFNSYYPISQILYNVTILKVTWQRSMDEELWELCSRAFPSLETLVLEGYEFRKRATKQEVKAITDQFPNLKKCTLVKIEFIFLSRTGSSLQLTLEQ